MKSFFAFINKFIRKNKKSRKIKRIRESLKSQEKLTPEEEKELLNKIYEKIKESM